MNRPALRTRRNSWQSQNEPCRDGKSTGGRVLAAAVAFLLVTLVIFGAALISAPTRGIRIFPLQTYIPEALNSGIWFVVGGLVARCGPGHAGGPCVYRIWPNRSATRRDDRGLRVPRRPI